jgi:hypothetical protein
MSCVYLVAISPIAARSRTTAQETQSLPGMVWNRRQSSAKLASTQSSQHLSLGERARVSLAGVDEPSVLILFGA